MGCWGRAQTGGGGGGNLGRPQWCISRDKGLDSLEDVRWECPLKIACIP